MKLTVTTLSDRLFTLEVSEDLELENFKALCEPESGIKSSEMSVIWNGRPLQNEKTTLKAYGVNDGDMLLLQHIRGAVGVSADSDLNPPGHIAASGSGAGVGQSGMPIMDFSNIQVPSGSRINNSQSQMRSQQNVVDDPAYVRDMLLANQHELAIIKERNPPLADALLSGSLEKFTEVFRKQQAERIEKEKERLKLVTANPFDPDVQKRIAEEIRLKNVESNMETAMEYAPESFGQVIMLYVDCIVNGHAVKAFVDSGAQMTIMSQTCAERCNIMRLVDSRWAGIAKGVGTQKIIGRIHLCQIQIGSIFLQSSFSVLENQPMDMLLGLDMLKRHQCCIDLKRNVLVIGTTNTETRFLTESELPEHARLNFTQLAESRSNLEMEDKELADALSKSAQESDDKNSTSPSIPLVPSSLSSPYPQAVIGQLMSYGFSEQQVLEELRKSSGNVDQALAALFAKSLNMP